MTRMSHITPLDLYQTYLMKGVEMTSIELCELSRAVTILYTFLIMANLGLRIKSLQVST